ncbi:hypothetical protein [Kitasatospora sp. MBT66]|uniref:hypothetical protein n=1 Tax=Kitasatospora sp. MBT66 TaxID=1444769 RepID=UPI0005BC6857|nr:hypothetical protein [Kitasatospora sp. MBT66]
MMISLVSAKSSGVTCSALALALASPRPTALAECDPAGGTIRTGYLQGGGPTAAVGLHRLATASRAGTIQHEFPEHWVRLDDLGHRMFLPGLTDPSQASGLAGAWGDMGRLLRVWENPGGHDVIIDAGRVQVSSKTTLDSVSYPAALLRQSDLVLLVVRNTLPSVLSAAPVVQILRADLTEHGTGGEALGVLMIEEGGLSSSEIGARLGVPVLAGLPWDEDMARNLTTGRELRRGKPARTKLMRQARSAFGPLTEAATRRQIQLRRPGALTGAAEVA